MKKNNSDLSRDIEKLIPEKNPLRDDIFQIKEAKNIFDEIELYSSKYAIYGKTTEIKYKVKGKNEKYFYLPMEVHLLQIIMIQMRKYFI